MEKSQGQLWTAFGLLLPATLWVRKSYDIWNAFVFSNCNCSRYRHSTCKRNRIKNNNGNGDIVLVMGETVLEQGERSKAIYKVQKLPKVKSCPRLPLRPQFR